MSLSWRNFNSTAQAAKQCLSHGKLILSHRRELELTHSLGNVQVVCESNFF